MRQHVSHADQMQMPCLSDLLWLTVVNIETSALAAQIDN